MKKLPPKIDTLAIVSINMPEPLLLIEFVCFSLRTTSNYIDRKNNQKEEVAQS